MAEAWRRLNFEQRTAAVGAGLLLVSTFGPFSFVEAAEVLIALSLFALLRARGEGRRFHLPFGDGAVVMAAGAWAAVLILIRLFDRPLGQNLLALACAAILVLAGLRERAKRPPDDLPSAGPRRDAAPGGHPHEREADEPTEELEAGGHGDRLGGPGPGHQRPG